MPKFYFNIVAPGDIMMQDQVGQDLPDRATAREVGLRAAKRYESHVRFGATIASGWYVEVMTSDNVLCWQLPIGGSPLSFNG